LRALWQRLIAALRDVPGLARRVPATGLVLACALAVGLGVHWLLGDAERVLDSDITRSEVTRETVTSLVLRTAESIHVGTASGASYSLNLNNSEKVIRTSQQPIVNLVAARQMGTDTVRLFPVTLNADLGRQFDPEAPPPALRRVLVSTAAGELEAEEGLLAVGRGGTLTLDPSGDPPPTPVLVGRRTLLSNQQQQQQQVASQTATTGLFRYDVGTDGKAQEVGEIGTLSDVRALAIADNQLFAVAGTGDGHVAMIDLSRSGPSAGVDLSSSPVGTVAGPVVAVAASGSEPSPVFAAARADGRVVVFRTRTPRARTGPGQTFESPDSTIYEASEAGLPATNWRVQAVTGGYTPISISDDGSRILASRGINEATEYFLMTVGEDAAIGEPTKLQQPFAEGDGLIGLPGMADAVFLGGPIADALQKAAPEMASILAESLGSKIAAVLVDRNRDAALILMMDSSFALVTADQPRLRMIGQVSTGLSATAISADGRLLAVIDSDGQLSMYDISGASMAGLLRAQQPLKPGRRLPNLSFSSDGKRIIVANGDGTIDLYSARDLHLIRREVTNATLLGLVGLAQSSGDFVLRATSDQSFEMIATATGLPVARADIGNAIDSMLVSGDGKTAAFRLGNGGLSIWRKVESTTPPLSGETFETVAAPVGLPDKDGLKFSADGARLMLRTRDGRLYVAATDDPETVPVSANRTETFFRFAEIPLDAPAVTADIAGDGSFLVAGDADNSLVVVDLTGATPQSFELPEHGAVVNHVAISPDFTKVAAASLDGRVRIVDLARERFVAGLPLARLASHGDTPKMIARRLDDAPGTFPDAAYLERQPGRREDVPAVIVFGSYSSLATAQASVEALRPAYQALTGYGQALTGYGAVEVYLREGAYRVTVETSLGQAEDILQEVRALAPETADAYVRLLAPWCPDGQARDGYKECGPPPPAAPAGSDMKKS
jgi:WD40 repeat protein